MSGSRNFASLGPLLLARKGAAKPAEDSRLKGLMHDSANDEDFIDLDALHEEPDVKRQQKRLLHSVADSNSAAITRLAAHRGKAKGKASSKKGRAAFTLRLDQQRHLKLKLASTIKGVSAQQLVTEALDLLLEEMPEIETLAAQVRRGGKKA